MTEFLAVTLGYPWARTILSWPISYYSLVMVVCFAPALVTFSSATMYGCEFEAEDVQTSSFSEVMMALTCHNTNAAGSCSTTSIISCALRCVEENNCRGFYYDSNTKTCHLAAGSLQHTPDPVYNLPGVRLYRNKACTNGTENANSSNFDTTLGATPLGVTTEDATTDGATTKGATTDGATTEDVTTEGVTTEGATSEDATTSEPPLICPSATGFSIVDIQGVDYCFKVVKQEVNFFNARDNCLALGAKLFHFEGNVDKVKFFKAAIAPIDPGVIDIWTGLQSIGTKKWKWDHNQREITTEEYNQIPFGDRVDADNTCTDAELDKNPVEIDDENCTRLKSYVCEI